MKYTTLVVKLPPIYTRIWPFYCVRAHQPGSCRVGSQKLFYEHPASGNALLYISLSSVVLIASFTSSAILNDRFAVCNSRLLPTNQIVNCDGRVRPIQGRTLFFTMLHRFLRAASGIRHQHGSGSDAAHPGIVPVFCAGRPYKRARKQCHFPAYCPILSA